MKIDPNQGAQGAQISERVGGAAAPQSGRVSSQSAPASDQTNLSSDAAQFSTLSAAAGQVPDVRHDRVAAISAARANGTYSVSNRQIATALVRDLGGSNG